MKLGWGILVPVALLAAVGTLVGTLRVGQIEVRGVETLDARTVVEASGLRPGERILFIRLGRVAQRVERLPGVAEALVTRHLPNRVVIEVRERVPVAVLAGHPQLVADASGHVFAPAVFPATLPVLEGWRGEAVPGSKVDEVAARVLQAFADFPSDLRGRAAVISIASGVVVRLRNGTEIRFGDPVDLEAKARAARAVLEAEGWRPVFYVDVRSPHDVVVRASPTSSPGSSPLPPSPAATGAGR